MGKFSTIHPFRGAWVLVLALLTFQVCGVEGLLQVLLNNDRVRIQPSPLIGGPKWLPVHCKVVLDNSHVFDFVPRNAASTETIQKLISLRSVPAIARTSRKNQGRETEEIGQSRNNDSDSDDPKNLYIDRAIQFCEDYDRDLHLVNNNCWSFAFDLIQHIHQPQIANGLSRDGK